MIHVQLKDKESFESLYRRFSKRYRQSNLAGQVKDKIYHSRKKTKRLKKQKALVSNHIRGLKEHLRRTGELEKNQDHRGRLVNVKFKVK